MLGGIEAGGTKFVCVVGTGPGDIRARARIDTTEPSETLAAVVEFFRAQPRIEAVGIASFGPVETRPGHPDHGRITTTPKPGWSGVDLAGAVREALGVPVGFDTDVNGAALGEGLWGAGRGLSNLVYMTVGTGIGGGVLVGGRPVHGLVHPEMGHVLVRRHPDDDFGGSCPFHGGCLEGMASGPAVEARWGRPPAALGDLLDRALALEAHYLASGLRNVVYTLAPERIILGGGLSELPGLRSRVAERLLEEMAGYAVLPEHRSGFVTAPGLGADSGVAGALALAHMAVGREPRAAGS